MTPEERDELLIRVDERLKRMEDRISRYESRCTDLRAACVASTNERLSALSTQLSGLLASMGLWRSGALLLAGLLVGIGAANSTQIRAWLALLM